MLASRGWDVTVFTAATPGAAPMSFEQGLSIRRVLPTRAVLKPSGVGSTGVRLGGWRGIERRPDVLIASLATSASALGLLLGRAQSVPTVLRIGGTGFARLNASWAKRAIGRQMIRACDVIVSNSSHAFRSLEPFNVRATTDRIVIRNGVAALSASPREMRRAREPTRVVFYTNGEPVKNNEAFMRLVETSPDMRFRVVGRNIGLASRPNLEVLGWRDDLGAVFQWADAVVNLSISEGSPNFCLQALAHRVPVVAFGNAGLLELETEYPSDVKVVPFGRVDLIRDELAKDELRLKAVEAQVPSMEQAADEWDELLRRLVRRTRTKT